MHSIMYTSFKYLLLDIIFEKNAVDPHYSPNIPPPPLALSLVYSADPESSNLTLSSNI